MNIFEKKFGICARCNTAFVKVGEIRRPRQKELKFAFQHKKEAYFVRIIPLR